MPEEWEDNPAPSQRQTRPLVAAMETRKIAGVEAPGFVKRRGKNGPVKAWTYDWRAPRFSAENTYGITAEQFIRPLDDVLWHDFTTEAMVVPYVLYGPDGRPVAVERTRADGRVVRNPCQPRVNKSALPWLAEQGYAVWFETLWLDIDNPKIPGTNRKRPWDQELLEAALERLAHPALASAHHYFTRGGMRLVQELDRAIGPDHFEYMLRLWWRRVRALGFDPDDMCLDWTHLYRPPKHVRPDDPADTQHPDPFMRGFPIAPVPWAPPADDDEEDADPDAPADARRPRTSKPKRPRATRAHPQEFVAEIPPAWQTMKRALVAGLVAQGEVHARHDVFLAIAGALATNNVPLELVPALVHAAAAESGAHDPFHHHTSALDTVQKVANEQPVKGTLWLARYPEIRRGVENALALARGLRLHTARVADLPTADEAAAVITRGLDAAALGLTVIGCPPGTGKSRAAQKYAATRARTPRANPDRAAKHSRTSIAVPTHALAEEYTAALRAEFDVPVKRLFSQGKLRDAAGQAVCKYADAANTLAAAGVTVAHELCDGRDKHEPCPYRTGCAAYPGYEGPEDAPVMIGPHAYLDSLGDIGGTGALIIDEPPAAILTTTITRTMLTEALAYDGFTRRYSAAMRPLLAAFLNYLAEPLDGSVTIRGALDRGAVGVGYSVLAEACRMTDRPLDAIPEDRAEYGPLVRALATEAIEAQRSPAPPFKWKEINRVRVQPAHGALMQRVGGTCRALRDAVLVDPDDDTRAFVRPPRVWVDEQPGGEVALVVKRLNEVYATALRRQAIGIVLDADLDLRRAEVEAIIDAEPTYVVATAGDGAPIERTLHQMKCSRAEWFRDVDGQKFPLWDGPLKRALHAAYRWAKRDPTVACVGLISFMQVERAVECLLQPAGEARWVKDYGYPPAELAAARAALGELLEAFRPILGELGHFGAIRGLNRWHASPAKPHDGLITIGDPWPNLGDVRRDCELLAIGQDSDQREVDLCRAELGQAQERIRSCRRRERAVLLHIGNIVPAGLGWAQDGVQLTEDRGGVLGGVAVVPAATFKAALEDSGMTLAEVAKKASVPERVIRKYLDGTTPISQLVWTTLQSVLR